ncbi:8670_t:CDS:2, partial [Funneliformis mosseae]
FIGNSFNVILCDFGLCKEAKKNYDRKTWWYETYWIVLLECIMKKKFYGNDKDFQESSNLQKQIIEKFLLSILKENIHVKIPNLNNIVYNIIGDLQMKKALCGIHFPIKVKRFALKIFEKLKRSQIDT